MEDNHTLTDRTPSLPRRLWPAAANLAAAARQLMAARSVYHRTIVVLMVMSAMPVAMLVFRVAHTGQFTYLWMIWNLFLAWLPVGFAYLAAGPGFTPWPFRLLFGMMWLLFLPNAPYMVTDLIHLHRGAMPVLYDAVLLFTLAGVGVALGLVSLRWIEAAVSRRFGAWTGRAFGVVTLGAAGFGIYLGRYLRWNSWDVFLRPGALAADIWPLLVRPAAHWQGWATTLLFTALLVGAYLFLTTLPEWSTQKSR